MKNIRNSLIRTSCLIITLTLCSSAIYVVNAINTGNYKGLFNIRTCDITFYFTVNPKGYVGGGRTGINTFKSDFWEFGPNGNFWVQKASFPRGDRCNQIAFTANNMGYVGLVFNGSTYFNDLYVFEPFNNSWVDKAIFPGPATYIGTGSNDLLNSPTFINDVWEFVSNSTKINEITNNDINVWYNTGSNQITNNSILKFTSRSTFKFFDYSGKLIVKQEFDESK